MTPPLPTASLILATALLVASSGAHAQNAPKLIMKRKPHLTTVQDWFGHNKIIFDCDQDGWDDLWCSTHKEISHRNNHSDTDGDGMTDYQEMVAWRNPFTKGPLPKKLTPEEILAAAEIAAATEIRLKANQAVTFAARRAAFAPSIQKTVHKPSRAERREAGRAVFLAADAIYRKQCEDAVEWQERFSFVSPEGVTLDTMNNGVPVFLERNNVEAATQARTTAVQPGGITGYNLTGQGFKMALWDDALFNHLEFTGRYANRQSGTATAHATGTAGTLIATGANPYAKGMCPASTVDSWTRNNYLTEMYIASGEGLSLSNHSYSVAAGWTSVGDLFALDGITARPVWWGDISDGLNESRNFGSYSDLTKNLDLLIFQNPDYLTVWSAGNDRYQPMPVGSTTPYYTFQNGTLITRTGVIPADGAANGGFDTIGELGCGKNTLTVGAINASGTLYFGSGSGPTDDGRVKPDLVAKGVDVTTSYATSSNAYSSVTGTSFSAPVVTGSINLLRELRSNLGRNPMWASTLKALVIHTATDLGNVGPDYNYGWGLINTQKAAELIDDDASYDSIPHIKEIVLPEEDFVEFHVRATGSEPLKVTICWTDSLSDSNSGLDDRTSRLDNKLNLSISDGVTPHLPWILDVENPSAPAATGVNEVDNVQQVIIANPVAGLDYVVRVDAVALNDIYQEISLIISGNQAESAAAHEIDTFVQTGAEEFMLGIESVVGANYQFQTSTNLINWSNMGAPMNAIRSEVIRPVPAPAGDSKRFWRVIRLDD